MKILSRLKVESSKIKLYKLKNYFPTSCSSPEGDWHYPEWDYDFYNKIVKKTYLDDGVSNMQNASYSDIKDTCDILYNTECAISDKFKKGYVKFYNYENEDSDNDVAVYNAAQITKYSIPKTKKAREYIDDKENTISFLHVYCWGRRRAYLYKPWERCFLVIQPEHVKYIETILNR